VASLDRRPNPTPDQPRGAAKFPLDIGADTLTCDKSAYTSSSGGARLEAGLNVLVQSAAGAASLPER